MILPCAVYTRKSSEEGLEQGFNSLDAQREACEAYVLSQKAQGWKVMGCYDDGGFSGGNVERPGLQRLLADIASRRVRIVVVYKVDRLTRSLADFAKLVELFDEQGVSFVSVTQAFNTTSSMGRLTLNVLLSFAQFEREVTGERIRDKIAASKRKGMWMGGNAPLGYLPHERTLAIDEAQAIRVREIYQRYLALDSVKRLKDELDSRGWKTPMREGSRIAGGSSFSRGYLYRVLANPIYVGKIGHKGEVHPGLHPAIVDQETWDRVQARLKANAQGQSDRSTAAEPSPLAGLIVDDQLRRFQPTHAKKGGKRYRYYFRPAEATEPALRIPAPELEGVVIGEVTRLLRDEQRVLTLMGDADARETRSAIAHAAAQAAVLADGASADRVRLLRELVERVVVKPEAIEIGLRGLNTEADDDRAHSISVPVVLQRRGQAVRLIIRGPDEENAIGPNPKLIALLAKANRWFDALSSGKSPSVLSIAQLQGMDAGEVIRIVYLAFLAPDIVESIVRGEHPASLGVKRLLALAPLPLDWNEQRRALGFSG
jgi:site-specific DNA recombinase